MSSESDPLTELAAVLRETGASPRMRRERIVRSTLYDLDYHVALIACVFFITAGDDENKPPPRRVSLVEDSPVYSGPACVGGEF